MCATGFASASQSSEFHTGKASGTQRLTELGTLSTGSKAMKRYATDALRGSN